MPNCCKYSKCTKCRVIHQIAGKECFIASQANSTIELINSGAGSIILSRNQAPTAGGLGNTVDVVICVKRIA